MSFYSCTHNFAFNSIEGDSRILMQKLARDEFKRYQKGSCSETIHCEALAQKLSAHQGSPEKAWNQEWEAVYELAEAVMSRIQKDGVPVVTK